MKFEFEVDIEVIVEPHLVRDPFDCYSYFERLAAAIRNRGENSVAATGSGKHQKHLEHHHKHWSITDNNFLGSVNAPDGEYRFR